MPKYRVFGTVTVSVSTVVEAEDEAKAKEKVNENWGGLTGYPGNGGVGDKLIGPNDPEYDTIEEIDDEPVWDDVFNHTED